jgi:integrase
MRYEGLRVGEVERATVDDLDADMTTLRVWGKGNKERIVPVFDEFLPYLKAWMGERGWEPGPLLRGGQGLCTRKVVGRVLARVAKAAGVVPFTAHKLRHTCGKDLIQRGVPANIVQAILGHESLATTSIYTQATGADVMSAKAIMARMVTVQTGEARQKAGGAITQVKQ